MATDDHLLVHRGDGICRITLNRPERRNALSVPMLQDLEAVLWDADRDRSIHCISIAGAGTGFCSGYDLSERTVGGAYDDPDRDYRDGKTIDDDVWFLGRSQRLRMAIFDLHKPVVAQIHGFCLAGGTDLALLCDMLIAADDARIGFPPVKNFGSPANNMWLYHCGPQWAKRLTLTGDLITGADAARIGLVMKAVPAHLLDAEVDGLLRRLATIDADLLSANKRMINLGMELMGARTLQRIAVEADARGHRAPAAREFTRTMRDHGVRHAIKARDAAFPDSEARVDRPEIRDAEGRFIDDSD
jgi:enoyl-CoA hydratase